MRAIFWIPPWPFSGNLDHFRNPALKHLVPQANTLSSVADYVGFVLPAQLSDLADELAASVKVIDLPLDMSMQRAPSGDAYFELYDAQPGDFAIAQAERLRSLLPEKVDVVLLWESPASFLRLIWPDALIISQMPGVFSRPPYPHTVTFDPTGLYREGTLHRHANDIQRGLLMEKTGHRLTHSFSGKVQEVMRQFQHVADPLMNRINDFDRLALLPLQTSAHYAFRKDTGFSSQTDLLWKTLESLPSTTGLLVTQYRSGLISETPLDDKLVESLAAHHPNLIYDSRIDSLDCVSQYLLQHVEEVVTASSSLGLQAMIWDARLHVQGATFLSAYDSNFDLDNLSWPNRCQNTLSVLLDRLNPLADAVVNDTAFLGTLVAEMLDRHRAGKTGLNLLPSFQKIDRGYELRLTEAFRSGRSAKRLGSLVKTAPACRQMESLRTMIADDLTKAVSFDVFDTILCRPFEKPADLWKFMEAEAVHLSNGAAVDFGRVRALCEVDTRDRLKESHPEIAIDQIYETMADFYAVPRDLLDPLKQREIEREMAAIRPRPFGRKLFDIARASGKPVYLISDMYLPQNVVEDMLSNAGYAGQYTELFLSSSQGCTKSSGDLFGLVLEKTGLAGKDLVHVGDNVKTDKASAEKKGIRPFIWSTAIQWMRSHPIFSEIYPARKGSGERARSALAGTTALGLFDAPMSTDAFTSLSGGDPFRLGYAVLGPLFTGYMLWLLREARRDGISDLFFMAREGWILKEIFDALTRYMTDVPQTHYLLGSRRAIRVAACRVPKDVLTLAAAPYDPGVSLSALIEGRFGVTLQNQDLGTLALSGLRTLDQPLGREIKDRRLLNDVLEKLMDRILANAAVERDGYFDYLDIAGFNESDRPGVVDIGWTANIQGALGDLIGRRTHGYYYATQAGAEIWETMGDLHRAYGGLSHSDSSRCTPFQFRHVMEFLTCHFSRSVVSVTQGTEGFQPNYRREPDFRKRMSLIRPLQNGAVEFSRNFQTGFEGDLQRLVIEPSLAESALTAFLKNPAADDARLFAGQGFEDSVGGISRKSIVASDARNPERHSVWVQGHRAAHSAKHIKPATGKADFDKFRGAAPEETRAVGIKNLENLLVKSFVSRRKYAKYARDRKLFFSDANRSVIRLYGKLTNA